MCHASVAFEKPFTFKNMDNICQLHPSGIAKQFKGLILDQNLRDFLLMSIALCRGLYASTSEFFRIFWKRWVRNKPGYLLFAHLVI